MKVTFQMPELMVALSCVYYLNSYTKISWWFFGIGLFFAFWRLCMNINAQKQKSEDSKELIQDVMHSAMAAFSSAGRGPRNIN
tara:strand:- start:912 stop:1160 length:249 start_codon:yes stop_codon:yes gene_type:complete